LDIVWYRREGDEDEDEDGDGDGDGDVGTKI
jgi:hypothetical protein